MAFFDNLGKKLSDTGKGISHKASEIASIAKLSNDIGNCEYELKNILTKLGEEYFEKYRDDETAEFYDLLMSAKELKEKIQNKRDEIAELKKAGLCPNCGVKVKYNAAYCSQCGAKLQKENPQTDDKIVNAEDATGKCPECGTSIFPGDAFCMRCGTKIY